MNLNAPLGAVARVDGVRALIAYAVGLAIGAALALALLAALFGIGLPVV